jgi:hypothetical protein
LEGIPFDPLSRQKTDICGSEIVYPKIYLVLGYFSGDIHLISLAVRVHKI